MQFGHSKDDPDRPQFKIAAAVLDPLGLPLATAVVPGNATDDPLYVPAIQAVQQSLGVGGRTYVGDCKMAALATRAFVAAGGDFYLCPLSENQLSRAERRELLQPVWDGTQALQPVWRPGPEGQPDELVAEGFCGGRGVDRHGGRHRRCAGRSAAGWCVRWPTRRPRRRPWSAGWRRPTAALRELADAQAGQEAVVSRGVGAGGGRPS